MENILDIESALLPIYQGTESQYEDIVYSYFRMLFEKRGYIIKIKRSGFSEIDKHIPSYSSGNIGKGSCDAYIFSSNDYLSFHSMLELESNGNIDDGIKQIKHYAQGLNNVYENCKIGKDIKLIVFDGCVLWIANYNFKTKSFTIIQDKIDAQKRRKECTEKIKTLFPLREAYSSDIDVKKVINELRKSLRGHSKLQANKAFIMTIYASLYSCTQKRSFDEAWGEIKSSEDEYEKKLASSIDDLKREINNSVEFEEMRRLYEKIASNLFELSSNKGVDLYGFIFEELASKESKKDNGEYYTPRHTIHPLIQSVLDNYLKWNKGDLSQKIVLDPFCGSAGFLYEYIRVIKSKFSLSNLEIENITKKSIYGADKNNIFAAYLNLYLLGDGAANLKQVKTSINWREHFLYNSSQDSISILDIDQIKRNIKNAKNDLQYFIKLYDPKNAYPNDFNEGYVSEESLFAVDNYLKSKHSHYDKDNMGGVDLLLTNIPYGKTTNIAQQIIENGEALYNSLESNSLRECIDFLRPAKQINGKIVEEGGLAVVVVPDSVLENPSDKAIRDYLISRCDILAIIRLPSYTFSPYAMEQTYCLVFRKIAPEMFDYNRILNNPCFMYYSLSDGKANSQNRYKTELMHKVSVKTDKLRKIDVLQYLHDDFSACFDPMVVDDSCSYKSKLELAWNYGYSSKNKEWDQSRITETWNGNSYEVKEGKKWGFYEIKRYKREIEKPIKNAKLTQKVNEYILDNDMTDSISDMDFEEVRMIFLRDLKLSPKEKEIVKNVSYIKKTENGFNLVILEIIDDVDLDPDSFRYLCPREENIDINEIGEYLQKQNIRDANDIVDAFSNNITNRKDKENKTTKRISDLFYVSQGVQFSKADAYNSPGSIPVYTAATDGPAYFVKENLPGREMLKGPALIWSRKGAKAGTIQLEERQQFFYTTDVSGAMLPIKRMSLEALIFYQYYIAGQVKKERQSKSNNSQLNKSKLENLKIFEFDDAEKVGRIIKSILGHEEDLSFVEPAPPVILSDYKEGCIPLYTLRAACGYFEDGEVPEAEGWIDASGNDFTPDPKRHFAVHAKGDSMLNKIKDGDICVFEWYRAGSREGEIVLTECSEKDLDYGGMYTIKKYHSEKLFTEEGWQHTKVELIPLNKDYDVIELDEDSEYRTVGIFKCVLRT